MSRCGLSRIITEAISGRRKIQILADHDELCWIFNLADAWGKLARWRLRLFKSEWNVVHRARIKHQASDELLRVPTAGEDKADLNNAPPELTIVPANKSKEVDEINGKDLIVSDAPNAIVPGLTAAYKTAKTQFIEPRTAEFPAKQFKDPLCRKVAPTVGIPDSQYYSNGIWILIHVVPIDRAIQKVIARSLQTCLLHAYHYPKLAGHPAERSMHDIMRREIYKPYVANDAYTTTSDCSESARKQAYKMQTRHFKLFPASDALECIDTNIFGSLLNATNGKQFVVIMADRYSKLTQAGPTLKTRAMHITIIF